MKNRCAFKCLTVIFVVRPLNNLGSSNLVTGAAVLYLIIAEWRALRFGLPRNSVFFNKSFEIICIATINRGDGGRRGELYGVCALMRSTLAYCGWFQLVCGDVIGYDGDGAVSGGGTIYLVISMNPTSDTTGKV